MSNNKYKFGQIVGIVLGCIAGSLLVQAVLGPRKPDHLQPYAQQPYPSQPYGQQFAQPYGGQVPQQQSVFEQALSMPKS